MSPPTYEDGERRSAIVLLHPSFMEFTRYEPERYRPVCARMGCGALREFGLALHGIVPHPHGH